MERLFLIVQPMLMVGAAIPLFHHKVKIGDIAFLILIALTSNVMFTYVNVIASLFIYVASIGYCYFIKREKWFSFIGATLVYGLSIIFTYIATLCITILKMPIDYSWYFVIMFFTIGFVPMYLFQYFFGYKIITFIERTETKVFASFISIFLAGVFFANIYFDRKVIDDQEISIMLLNVVVFGILLIVSCIIFMVYLRALHIRMQTKQEKLEYDSLKLYTSEIESQYREIRTLRHDYQNIMLSLDSFFDEGDYEGLREYYNNYMKKSIATTLNDDYRIDDLSNIEIREVKSVLATKLIRAQQLGINVSFEARDVLEKVNIDPIYLIRMLGIILDNAIEELVELENGTLNAAVLVDDKCVTFIVENDCSPEHDKLHVLQQESYTTKNNHSGLGLKILNDIAERNDNLLLETNISDDRFTQKIIIYNE